ncbi:PREDICTED: membrane-spanning 4-domains subfamily A member 8-like [Gekko japonicus]|uniref:Membrane-spanning 4-domains subfamily A member 8-like n=1 Tax=Gekko japonicus TaxID=146911 RepID=A0ABM1KED3_GEKJA|nr:PREDICTED: membrane-spanning 4-domains subfamily A member 8-like [Gekko japonicus]
MPTCSLVITTDPERMANGTRVIIPPNGLSLAQARQITAGTVIQPGEMVQLAGWQLGNPYQLQQKPPMFRFEKFIKTETKSLSAIQIIIGLIHVGFGGVMTIFCGWDIDYFPLTVFGGYPFWGGIFFIFSGLLSVVLEKQLFTHKVKCGMGMNIAGAVIALMGIILYALEWFQNSMASRQDDDLSRSVGTGLCVLLLMFSFLEFCIAASMAHYQFLAVCCSSEMALSLTALQGIWAPVDAQGLHLT